MPKKSSWGGARIGAGRKAMRPEERLSATVLVRFTEAEVKALKRASRAVGEIGVATYLRRLARLALTKGPDGAVGAKRRKDPRFPV